MGDKNPKKGKKPKKDKITPMSGTVERVEPELVDRKKKPL